MFEKRSELIRFLAVAETGTIGLAAERLNMNQPALSRIIARLERRLGSRLFERLPRGVRLTPLGTTVAGHARRILREYQDADQEIDASRSGRAGTYRVTASPTWSMGVLAPATVRFQEDFPGIELTLETTTRAEGLRRLDQGESDLHCGGIDGGEALPGFLRRERFIDMTMGIVAWHDHPLLAGAATDDALASYPWIDFGAPAIPAPGDARPSLRSLLDQIHANTPTRVQSIVRANTAGLFLMATGPYLAWLSIDFLERFPGHFLHPLPVSIGRYSYRSGFVARRDSEDLPPFRRFQAIVREIALGRSG